MAKKKYYDGMGRMEKEGMIREDKSAVANLPQNVIYRDWPSNDGDYRNYNLNDTMSGIDVQMRDDAKRGKKDKYPEKY